jgi:hypothetical protein
VNYESYRNIDFEQPLAEQQVEYIEDFDAVSLYPSAIHRASRDYGYPLGPARLIKDEDHFDRIKDKYKYMVEIRPTYLENKHYDIPLMSNVKKTGGRVWANTIEELFNEKMQYDTIVCNFVEFEDFLNYYDMEYEFIQGLYWKDICKCKSKKPRDGGRFGEILEDLFNLRLHYKSLSGEEKKKGSCMQLMVKLVMNSIYGKLILKPGDHQFKILKKNNSDEFIERNYRKIEFPIVGIRENRIIKMCTNTYDHQNAPHWGSIVLSMSKRIMNEPIAIANEHNLPIYYMDTDSLHMKAQDVETLGEKFFEKYGRELIGSHLGQLHTDFDMSGCHSVRSILFICVGKKMYLDVLHGISYDTGEDVIGYHVKMKGAGSKRVINYCEKNNISLVDFYLDLYNYGEHEINMLMGYNSVAFDFSKFCITKKSSFYRTIRSTAGHYESTLPD